MFTGEEIRIKKDCRPDGTETYHLSRWLNDKPHEQYRPMTKEEVSIATLHYLSNFEPPRSHVRLDKLIG